MKNTVAIIMMVGSFILVLGTAGSSDLNTISFEQIVIQLLIAFIMFFVGFVIVCKEQILNTCAYLIAQIIIKYREVKHR